LARSRRFPRAGRCGRVECLEEYGAAKVFGDAPSGTSLRRWGSHAMIEPLYHDLIALLAIFNPVGIVPQYIYFTRDVAPWARKRLALRCVLIAAVILLAFIVLGQIILEAMEIGIPAFKIAGGFVLMIIALRMIFESVHLAPTEEEKEMDEDHHRNLAVFPLATPLIAGHGGSWSSSYSRTTAASVPSSRPRRRWLSSSSSPWSMRRCAPRRPSSASSVPPGSASPAASSA
jgi:MarC family membrane protein